MGRTIEAAENSNTLKPRLTQGIGHRRRVIAIAKKIAWRATAVWLWLRVIGYFLAGGPTLDALEHHGGILIVYFLKIIDLQPGNTVLFFTVLKAGWFLTITGFSSLQLIGFLSYTFFFPITVLLAIPFRSILRGSETSDAKNVTQTQTRKLPLRAVTGFIFLAWISLYGNSSGKPSMLMGIVIVGGLFASRLYTAFTYALPAEEKKATELFSTMLRVFVSHCNSMTERLNRDEIKTPQDIEINVKIIKITRKLPLYLALTLRGREGRNRIGLIVLFRYIVNLLILGLVTVLFWALMIRLSLAPQMIPLSLACSVTAAHVFPGLSVPGNLQISWGLEVGIAATSWLIFVVYAGPAASMFPAIQQSYISVMTEQYKIFRRLFIQHQQQIRVLHIRGLRIKGTTITPVMSASGITAPPNSPSSQPPSAD